MVRLRSGVSAGLLVLLGCAGGDGDAGPEGGGGEAAELAAHGAGVGTGPAAPAPVAPAAANPQLEADRRIFEATMERAQREGVHTLPMGDRIVALGRWFVGSEYVPGTLEVAPEGLVVNLRQFDCVTYVESMLAMARVLGRPDPTFDGFLTELRDIRYRDGVLAGYASRLHYFSDWILDNERMGIVDDVTRELGGVPLTEPIDFMSANRELYPALASAPVVEEIRAMERGLAEREIHYIPKDRIHGVAEGIRNGDVIAATSAVQGLDVAHTGLAIWIDDELHLMHAPLVGSSVEISELPLADRIQAIDGQDGIMVARPSAG